MTKSSATGRGWKLAASLLALSLGAGLTSKAEAIVTPDDVPPSDVVDNANTAPWLVGLGIRTEAGNSGGSCSGLLINPRTVLFAAHCVDGLDPGDYDNDAPGDRAQVGYTTDPTFGRTNLREYLFGDDFAVPAGDARTVDARSVMVWYDPRSRFGPLNDPNGGTFLPADIAIAAFDTPSEILGRDGRDGVGLLFSPVDRLVEVMIGGFGTAGNGFTGTRLAGTEDTFFRRVATNMLGYLGSEHDIAFGVDPPNIAEVFAPTGLNYQDLYWMDFDDPQNRPFDATVNANPGVTTTFDFNVFEDEATDNEAITGAGDSGSPLVTSAYGRDVSLGVLSQGSRFFHDVLGFEDDNFVWFPNFSDMGTTAGYNPLFLFWDQIVVNNPYKYVQARAGNREWTDASTWVQEIDPLYYTLAANGTLRNQLPNTPALGSSDAAGNLGTINPNPAPIAECAFTLCPPTGGGSAPQPGAEGLANNQAQGRHSPPAPPPPPPPRDTADWLTGGLLQVNTGALTGPGTTGFVPDNTNGTPGLQNSTRFFEVNLRHGGTLSLTGADIEIDRLNIRGVGAHLNIRSGASLTTNITSYMDVGRLTVNGTFNPLAFDIGLGILSGGGTINAPGGVANLAGVISPGNGIGTLTINGDYAQTGFGTVYFEIGKTTQDLLEINGHATIAGNLLVQSNRKLRFGNRFTVVHADSISGNFDRTFGSGTLLFGRTVADADSVDLVIDAHSLFSLFGSNSQWASLGAALDLARSNGNYAALQGVYDLVDYIQMDQLNFAMPTIAPVNTFQTVPLAVQYSQGFTRGLDARTAELRSGVRGMSPRSALTGFRIAQAGAVDEEEGGAGLSRSDMRPMELGDRLGFFISGQGNLSAVGEEAYGDERYNPAHLSAFSSADMTVGADYRVSDNFAIGVATTMSRYLSRDSAEGVTPMDHTGYGAMLYTSAWEGAWYLDSYLGVARHEYLMARTPGVGLGEAADSAPGAVQTLGGVRAGWSFAPMDGLVVGPTVGLNYSDLNMDAYSERGGGDFALEIDSRSLRSITAETALQFTYQPYNDGAGSPFAAYGRVGLVTELGDGVDLVHARFAAAPDIAFDIDRELDREWVSAATGFSYQFDDNMSANFEAASDMGRGELSNTSIRAGFNWQF